MKSKSLCYALLVVLFVLILGSCNIIYTIDLYLGDIIEVADEKENLFITATFAFGAPSEEDRPKLEEFIKNKFRNAQNFRTESIEFSDYIFCDIDVPLQPDNTGDYFLDPVYLTAQRSDGSKIENKTSEESASYRLTLYFNKKVWGEMSKYIEDEFYQKMNLEDMEFNFNFYNDSSEDIVFQTGAVYINEKPVPYMSPVPIPRRKKISLKFSDVLRDSLAYNPVIVGEFIMGKE